MARILYGVASEGMGHCIRSQVVIKHLQNQGHEVKVVTADRSYQWLKQYADTTEIGFFRLSYFRNNISILLTLFDNVIRLPAIIFKSLRVGKIIQTFKPDFIISDVENVTSYYGLIKDIPVITIDNFQSMAKIPVKVEGLKARFSRFLANLIIRLFIAKRDVSIATSLAPKKISDSPHFHITDPILRSELNRCEPSNGDHILIYHTSPSKTLPTELLQGFAPQKFIVYGYGVDEQHGNVTYKKPANDGFVADLQSAKAVVTNGGFTLISESIQLKKPVLSIPIGRQFEQEYNASLVDKMGVGMKAEKMSPDALATFMAKLDQYRAALKTIRPYSNEETFAILDREIEYVLSLT